MQIRTKLTLQFILVVVLIIVFSFGIIYYSSETYRRNEFYQRLENKAFNTYELFLNYRAADPALLVLFDRSQKDKLPGEYIVIYNDANTVVYASHDSLNPPLNQEMLSLLKQNGELKTSMNQYEVFAKTFSEQGKQLYIFAMAIDKYGLSKLNNLKITLLILTLLITSIVALAGWIYSGRALAPLTNIINEVNTINVNRLDSRLNVSQNKDEFGRLIETFNLMLDQIEGSVQLQRLFLSGASHELKNPLTSITSQLQVVLMAERTTEEYKTILKSVKDDIRRLNRTTHDLIEYARLSYSEDVQFTRVRIDDTLWQCREEFLKTNPECKINVNFSNLPSNEEQLIVNANEPLLKVAFNNLIDNACKFSNNKLCTVDFEVKAQQIELRFKDNGLGMSADQLELIFEPFYRANNTAEIRGHGLGLPLTKKIADLHQADLTVKSQLTKGSEFRLNFKIA